MPWEPTIAHFAMMVRKITHPNTGIYSLWEQGYLAGLRDAGMSVNKIHQETGASKGSVLKYTSPDCSQPQGPSSISKAESKRKTTQQEDDTVSIPTVLLYKEVH